MHRVHVQLRKAWPPEVWLHYRQTKHDNDDAYDGDYDETDDDDQNNNDIFTHLIHLSKLIVNFEV